MGNIGVLIRAGVIVRMFDLVGFRTDATGIEGRRLAYCIPDSKIADAAIGRKPYESPGTDFAVGCTSELGIAILLFSMHECRSSGLSPTVMRTKKTCQAKILSAITFRII